MADRAKAEDGFRWTDDAGVDWGVILRWRLVKGRFEVVEVRVIGIDDQRPVTAETLRRLPLGTIIRERRRQWLESEALKASDSRTQNEKDLHSDALLRFGHRGVATTPEELREVARVYNKARAWGDSVTKAVAERFDISASTAAKRIMRARRAGFIDGGRAEAR